MSEAGAVPERGELSIDQAASAIAAMQEPEEQEQQPVEPEAPAATETTEAVPAATGEGEASEPNAEAEAGEVEAETPIDPPQFWKAEAKERFRELPRELQEIVLEQETSRNAFTSKAAQEAAETRKAAEAEKTRLGQFNEQLAKLVPQAEQTFADRWANVDWVQVTDQFGAEHAQRLRFQYENEQKQLSDLKKAQAATSQAEYQKFVEAEAAKLATEVPDLADPKEGPSRRQALGEYLVKDNGISPQAIQGMTATEAKIAWKAYQWDRSQAQAKALAAKPKQPAAVAQPQKPAPSRPTAAQTTSSPQSARLRELSRKKSLTIDDLVELQMLKAEP